MFPPSFFLFWTQANCSFLRNINSPTFVNKKWPWMNLAIFVDSWMISVSFQSWICPTTASQHFHLSWAPAVSWRMLTLAPTPSSACQPSSQRWLASKTSMPGRTTLLMWRWRLSWPTPTLRLSTWRRTLWTRTPMRSSSRPAGCPLSRSAYPQGSRRIGKIFPSSVREVTKAELRHVAFKSFNMSSHSVHFLATSIYLVT